MTRRRLALAAALLLLICSPIVFRPDSLTTEEECFVGAWRTRDVRYVWSFTLAADHRVYFDEGAIIPLGGVGRWWVRNGMLYIDCEPDPVRRTLRPLLNRIGVSVIPVRAVDTANFDPDSRRRDTVFVRPD
jgi:hypothetical protein